MTSHHIRSCVTYSGGDGRDDARRLNDQLMSELNSAQDDMKRLRQAIDQMAREYEAAKDVDVFRRYGMLKRAVKRTIMHLRLHQNNCEDQTMVVVVTAGPSSGKARAKDEQRKRTDHINSAYSPLCPVASLEGCGGTAPGDTIQGVTPKGKKCGQIYKE